MPRGVGIERLRDPPTEWSRQFAARAQKLRSRITAAQNIRITGAVKLRAENPVAGLRVSTDPGERNGRHHRQRRT